MANGSIAVSNALREHNVFVITSHINPEGDAIGSAFAMIGICEALGKTAYVLNHDPIPPELSFLPYADHLITPDLLPDEFVSVVVDCATLERSGHVQRYVRKGQQVINIDHHPGNPLFGDINWVDDSSSSVGEMLYELVVVLGIPMSYEIALNLYTSIATDTGFFAHANTTAHTHQVVSHLLECAVKPDYVQRKLHEHITPNDLKLLERVLRSLTFEADGKVAYLTLQEADMVETGSGDMETEHYIKYARWICGVEIAILFKELATRGEVKVSFRSVDKADVNELAAIFGGGGHVRAAGCTITSSLDDARKWVLTEATRAVEKI